MHVIEDKSYIGGHKKMGGRQRLYTESITMLLGHYFGASMCDVETHEGPEVSMQLMKHCSTLL